MSYIRRCSLIVYGSPPLPGGTGLAVPAAPAAAVPASPSPVTITVSKASQPAASQPGIELGTVRVVFKVSAMDADAPPTAVIRAINLSDETANRVQREFQNVTLQAGYEDGPFGVIFQGSITRVAKGRINNIETYVDIFASNLDAIYNFGVVNKTLKAGSSLKDRVNAIEQSVNSYSQNMAVPQNQLKFGSIPNSFGTGGVLPRGKVLFGMARDHLTNAADSGGCTWYVGADGKVYIVPMKGVLPGEAVVLSSQTGMIGVPVATPQGIEATCLLNPSIKLGTQLKIDNASINTTINKGTVGFPAYSDYQFFANTSADGLYRTIVAEHDGDSRDEGADWTTRIVALAVDASGGNTVAAY